MDERIEAYKAQQQDALEKLVPYLIRLDYSDISQLENVYQAEQHNKLFGLSLSSAEVSEVHADIKGAHHFLLWLKEKIKKTNMEG